MSCKGLPQSLNTLVHLQLVITFNGLNSLDLPVISQLQGRVIVDL